MANKPIEIILMRQLAVTLATPIFLIDTTGRLVFYNEAAERLLGLRFEETGEMPMDEWGRRWQPTCEDGSPMPPDRVPLAIALRERRTVHARMGIRGADGVVRQIQVTGVPLIAMPGELVGAAAIFWEDRS